MLHRAPRFYPARVADLGHGHPFDADASRFVEDLYLATHTDGATTYVRRPAIKVHLYGPTGVVRKGVAQR